MKKIFLTLLLALMSVTGAWAESYKVNYTNVLRPCFDGPERNQYSYIYSKSNNYVQIRITKFECTDRCLDLPGECYMMFDYFLYAYIIVESKDPDNVTINSVTIGDTTYPASGRSWGANENGGLGHYVESNVGEEKYINTILVEYTINHTHVPAENWSYDNSNHWHVCNGYGALCPSNNIIDRANHTYNIDVTNDVTAYTCSVCGYVNNTIKSQYEARDYLSMNAFGGNVTLGMVKTGTPEDYDLLYSFDKVHWTPVSLTATNPNIVEIPSGHTCYFRHGTNTATERISMGENDYWTFTMTGTGTIAAGGNVMSLLDATCKKTNVGSYAFVNLFKECDLLTKAPTLPAKSLGERCYMGMFEGTNIMEAPELPAASVVAAAYQNMFNGCKNITAITLANITTIANTALSNWLTGTAEGTEGVLTAPDAMVGNSEIMNNLPDNWMFKQIKDYIRAISNAIDGTADMIKSIGADYIEQIKTATSNASALTILNDALNDINTLKKYNSQIVDGQFVQPTEPGMRMKVTKKDGKVYEFQVTDTESTEYYRATE